MSEMNHRLLVGFTLLGLLSAACSSEDEPRKGGGASCVTTRDCDDVIGTDGYLCIGACSTCIKTCQPCTEDIECSSNAFYGSASICQKPGGRCFKSNSVNTGGGNAGSGGASSTAGTPATGGRTGIASGGTVTITGGAGNTTGGALPTGGSTARAGSGGISSGGLSTSAAGSTVTGATGGATSTGGSSAASGGVPATGGSTTIASGGSSGACSSGNARTPSGTCVVCNIGCNNLGETGRVYPETLSDGVTCICETQTGYFHSVASGIGSFPCDKDADGWIRDSAKPALESSDAALRANARCTLRKASQIVLENEAGQVYPLYLTGSATVPTVTALVPDTPSALPLYESERNDDDLLIGTNANVPLYGSLAGQRQLHPRLQLGQRALLPELHPIQRAMLDGHSSAL